MIGLIGLIELIHVIHFSGSLCFFVWVVAEVVVQFRADESWFRDELFPREFAHLGTAIASPLSRV